MGYRPFEKLAAVSGLVIVVLGVVFAPALFHGMLQALNSFVIAGGLFLTLLLLGLAYEVFIGPRAWRTRLATIVSEATHEEIRLRNRTAAERERSAKRYRKRQRAKARRNGWAPGPIRPRPRDLLPLTPLSEEADPGAAVMQRLTVERGW